jgi:hypothetical protein
MALYKQIKNLNISKVLKNATYLRIVMMKFCFGKFHIEILHIDYYK